MTDKRVEHMTDAELAIFVLKGEAAAMRESADHIDSLIARLLEAERPLTVRVNMTENGAVIEKEPT